MRLCRFELDGTVLTGFYHDEWIIPVDLACEAYSEAMGVETLLDKTESLLDLLPPGGASFQRARDVARWVARQDPADLNSAVIPCEDCTLLVPIPSPPKILLLAGNYPKHVEERGYLAAERAETFPYVFMKPPSTTLTNPGGPIVIPGSSPDQIDWECELGVVIGARCRDVEEADALGYVAGYTVVNDVSDRGFRPNPGRKPRERDKFFDWLHGKWHDTFFPVGPCVVSADAVPDPQDLALRLSVNGETKQDSNTSQMVFPVAAVVAFLSKFVTLEPGDIIATGTPAGVGSARGEFLKPGDLVEATIERIGTLENPVVAENDDGDLGDCNGDYDA
jgi:2-keto-4-pentenoate hydratase/2-oxohepta-3-ene-1,7-dioic acid hydratase in catechol pathway